MSSKNRSAYGCLACGQRVAKWVGRCPECGEWGSLAEVAPPGHALGPGPVTAPAVPLPAVSAALPRPRSSGLAELDRVLGGGLVAGGVVLLAGEPGVGKSTLLLEVARAVAGPGHTCLLITGEESVAQVRLRAERIGVASPHVYLAAETGLPAVLGHLETHDPAVLIVDSVQTVSHPDVDGAPGSVTQVRECAAVLVREAKARGIPLLLAGHVTKDGSIAGPRVLEHLVDVVLSVEGDRHTRLRLVRAVKNRYGPTDEVGCFELTATGLSELSDPSGLFLSRSRGADAVPGTCVSVALEGRRPLVAEIQALVVDAVGPPRRAVSGLDSARMSMLLAVLQRRARLPIAGMDVYLSTVGGVRLTETAVDLAAALAVVSAEADIPLPGDLVALGEVGLAGEIRPVAGVDRRLAEAARLGFRRALVPSGHAGPDPQGMTVRVVADLTTGIRELRALAGSPRGGTEHSRASSPEADVVLAALGAPSV
jgi:DNA repair protein RadA/Sms